MQKILVFTDFSSTATNAARYAVEFAKQISVPEIILFHAYQAPLSVDPAMPVLQLYNLEEIKRASTDGLTFLKESLSFSAGDSVRIETFNEFTTLSNSVKDVLQKTGAELIIMGITGGSGLDVLVGSSTITVADTAKVPVIIVPATCIYKPVKNLLWVCDEKNKITADSVLPIKRILKDTMAKINVLSIDQHNNNHEKGDGKSIAELLNEFHPQYHFVHSKNYHEAVNEFVESNQVDMIITLSKKHGFFENIFKANHTKQLAFHTHVPLICVHEEG